MRKTQKIWEIIKPKLEIEVRKGERFIVPKDQDLIVACPKFFYMSDEEFDMLLEQKKEELDKFKRKNLRKNKWLKFIEDKYYTGKTKRWWVKHKETKEILASIKWHNGWRQYVVYPYADTFWSSGCLQESCDFINKQMKKWKQKKN